MKTLMLVNQIYCIMVVIETGLGFRYTNFLCDRMAERVNSEKLLVQGFYLYVKLFYHRLFNALAIFFNYSIVALDPEVLHVKFKFQAYRSHGKIVSFLLWRLSSVCYNLFLEKSRYNVV